MSRGRRSVFFVNTGAEVTVITEGVARVLNKEVKKTGKKLLEAGGGALEVLGEVEISMRKGGASTRAKAAVVRGAGKPLLGRPEIAALGLGLQRFTDFEFDFFDSIFFNFLNFRSDSVIRNCADKYEIQTSFHKISRHI